jgi:ribosomal protein L7/L12
MTIPDYVLLACLLIANGLAFSHTRGIQELERKLNLVLTHLGIDPTAQVAPSSHVIILAADPQQRIEAIKAYREQTGAGLKEAVAVIDKIAASAKGAGA